jgi:hypothetical protein
LERITKLNEEKEVYAKDLFIICLSAANLLIGVGNIGTKPVVSFVNKMFKMADQYMSLYNDKLGENATPQDKLSRNLINKSFDLFKKKKDGAKND